MCDAGDPGRGSEAGDSSWSPPQAARVQTLGPQAQLRSRVVASDDQPRKSGSVPSAPCAEEAATVPRVQGPGKVGTEGPGAGRASLAPRPWTEGRGRGPADGESRAHRARPGLPASAPARLPCPHGGPGIAPRPSPPAHGGAVCVRQLAQLAMTSTAAPAGGSQARPHSRRQTTGVASGTRGQDSAWSPKLKPLRSRARCHSEPCSQGAPLSPMTPGGLAVARDPWAPPSHACATPRPGWARAAAEGTCPALT